MTFVKIKFWSGTKHSWLRLQDDLNASIVRPWRLWWWLCLREIRLMQTKLPPRSSCDDFCSFRFAVLVSVVWAGRPDWRMTLISCHMSGGAADPSILNDLIQPGDELSVPSRFLSRECCWHQCGLSACLCFLCSSLSVLQFSGDGGDDDWWPSKCTENSKAVIMGMKHISTNPLFEREDNSYYTLQI